MWKKQRNGLCRPHRLLVTAGLLLAVACGPSGKDEQVKMKGSDTVLPIAQTVVEAYKLENPALEISVTGGGSGVGIAALLSGTTDIAMASRHIKLSEKLKLKQANVPYTELVVAYDALALAVHPGNPVDALTREQLEGIYTGVITNWKEVGGADEKIVVYSRENSSGTHEFFKEMVLQGREFAPTALMMPATGAIIQSLEQTTGAIGYVGLAYLEGAKVKPVRVSYDQGASYAMPSIANAANGRYPIVRPLYFYFATAQRGKFAPFLDFMTGPKGQELVKMLGFVPVLSGEAGAAAIEAEQAPRDTASAGPSSTTSTVKGTH